MNPKFKIVPIMFLIIITIAACSNNKNTSNPNNSGSPSDTSHSTSQIENTQTQMPLKKAPTVTAEKILNILSTKNSDVIDSLSLSDSDSIKSLNGERFYVPVFQYAESGILIGFNGASFDLIDKVKKEGDTPIFVIPNNGTIIRFGKKINFCVGNDLKQFEEKFGKGNPGEEGNLKGDKQNCSLTYEINNLSVRFTSLDGDDFKKYDVYITKLS